MTEISAEESGPVLESWEQRSTTERLVRITCEWCGAEVERKPGRGRPPRYCSPGHRQRAYELRTVLARRDRDRARGEVREEPVREVVERVETVTRTVVRQGPPQYIRVPAPAEPTERPPVPETVQEWLAALALLRLHADRYRTDPHVDALGEALVGALVDLGVLDDPESSAEPVDVSSLPRAERRRREREARKRRGK